MAQNWPDKAPTEVVERRWTVPLPYGDAISTVTAVGTGVTVDSDDYEHEDAVVILSGGSALAEATVTITVVTDDGLTLVETFYIAIRSTSATPATTVRDVVDFALRKVVGIAEEADADQAGDALERLQAMIDLWRIAGLDLGIAATALELTDTLDIPAEFIPALKFNLRVAVHDQYGLPLSAVDASMADESKRMVQNRLLRLGGLNMPGLLANPSLGYT